MSSTTDSQGRSYGEDDPQYDRVHIDNLQSQVSDLQTAIVDLQHRVSRLDGEALQWPGDAHEPRNTKPL